MQQPEELMPLTEHLGELRRRIIYVLLVFAAALAGGFLAAQPVYTYLVHDGQAAQFSLHAISFWDGVGIYMKIALLLGLALTCPFIVYQLWKFVSPGLLPQERSAAGRYVPYTFVLFVLGAAFAYYVIFPMALSFTTSVNRNLGLEETYGVAQYFTFLFNIVLPVSLLFELPLAVMLLTRLRLVTPRLLRKMRRVSYFALVFVAVVITPPDVVSDLLVSVPLLGLYEVSVLLSTVVYRKQQTADARLEEELGAEE
ncbi:twin-arginine translocase subunit TatC [Paenibacillus sp. JX-17]|uniref:Sec-independent protein translocase protein TatC n=1 Tax=Paenibacillus lacisoli TaxID=3064525 RepID=A0ABT9CF23_9BACL|nr:twin-arginine translocase subunit TatC [Paenibacillus sp. JX-17]MDO7907239.1 twin-arginine translocase subunit TatC [Paenibacillus sp. JX-17]